MLILVNTVLSETELRDLAIFIESNSFVSICVLCSDLSLLLVCISLFCIYFCVKFN